MNKKILILICLILFIFSVASVSATEDVNQTADDNADDLVVSDDTLSVSLSDDEISAKDDGTFTALQEKIYDAPEGSTINLENDYKYNSEFSTDGIRISKALTINGNGHVIDALGQSRIFYISSNVNLNSITLKNGDASDGGAIRYYTNDIYQCNISCVFINNHARNEGGAIYFSGDVSNCNISSIFINNSAEHSGGAISFDGKYDKFSNCYISGEFTGNSLKNPQRVRDGGSAIYFYSEYTNCNVSAKFIDNFVGDSQNYVIRGGAIYNCGLIDMAGCTFVNNNAYNDKCSAIYNTDTGQINMANCEFKSNNVAIFNKGQINMANCEFGNNHKAITNANIINMTGCTFVANYGTISNVVYNDDSWRDGEPNYFYGILNANGCSFVNNSVPDYAPDSDSDDKLAGGSDFSDYSINSNGGAICCGVINIGDCTFRNNSASYRGGAIYNTDLYGCGEINADSCTFVDNTAVDDGGAIYSDKLSKVTNSFFKNNSPNDINKIDTGFSFNHVSVVNSNLNVDLVHNGNRVDVNGQITVKINGKSTKIKLNSGTATFKLSDLKIGEYDLYLEIGGDDYCNPYNTTEKIKIVDSNYRSFTDLQNLIDEAEAGSTIKLKNNFIYGLNDNDKTIKIEKSINIEGNGHTIDGNNKVQIFRIYSSNVNLKNINFTNGKSNNTGGGAIYSDSDIIIDSCNFINNTADNGGAVYLSKKVLSHPYSNLIEIFLYDGDSLISKVGTHEIHSDVVHAVISNSIFESNLAYSDGGAIYSESDLSLDNTNFYDNAARDEGGAIYTSNGYLFAHRIHANYNGWYYIGYLYYDYPQQYRLNISGTSSFKNNSAEEGGAIKVAFVDDYTYSYGATFNENGILILGKGVVFDSNTANVGGALSLNSTNSTINNVKFTNNGAESIYSVNDSNIYISNSVFSNNLKNSEFIRYINHDYPNSLLYLNKNKMSADNSYDVYYRSVSPLTFKTKLVFGNYTVSKNNYVNLGELKDGNGNTINIPEINVTLTKVDNSKITDSVTLKFDENAGGYKYYCNLDAGVYKVTGSVSQDIATNYDVVNGILTVSSVKLDVTDVTKNYGGSERLVATLTENNKPIAGAKININLNGVDYPKTTDSNGQASMAINLPANTYIATATYGDISATAKVTVKQLTTKTALSSNKNSHNSVTLTATVSPSTATGNVVFNVNGKDYPASKISDAKATYTLNDLAVGSYNAKATYKGDVNHKASTSDSVKFTVEDVKIDVSAPDLTKYYHGPERFVVTVKENNVPIVGKDVIINLNGKPYTRTTDSNGQASMAINLNGGVYTVASEFEGIKVNSKITVKSTISGDDVTKIFKNGTQYYAKFVDTKGNLIKNTDVKFNINGVFYTRTTNDKGVARMNINLPPKPDGYIITAENPNSTERYTNVIKVLPSIVENHDLTKYYRNESKYTLRIIGDNGKPVGAGVAVKLNINGVFYTRTTNASGYMSMNINLPPGTYTVTAEYNGLMASNTIKVLSVLQTKNLKMSYRDGSKFEAKILDGKGKPYAGQTVTFNINGVLYQRATGDDGVARLTINLIAGEYIITSTYNGLNAANKVTISG